MSRRPWNRRHGGQAATPAWSSWWGTLIFREREILGLLAHGLNIRRIAQQLCLSYQTVRSHIFNVFVKLGVHSQVEAVRFALEHRVVEAPASLPRSTAVPNAKIDGEQAGGSTRRSAAGSWQGDG